MIAKIATVLQRHKHCLERMWELSRNMCNGEEVVLCGLDRGPDCHRAELSLSRSFENEEKCKIKVQNMCS